MSDERKKAVVLLSGGVDSTTVLAIAKEQGFDVYALSFMYGQRHKAELDAARRVAQHMGAEEHLVAQLDLRLFGGSALTSDELKVPKQRALKDISEGIPVTYVPARNTIFLSQAMAWAEVLGSSDLFIGVNALDYNGYPDCRPEFIEAFQAMADKATKAGVEGRQKLKIHTPLIHMTKADIVQKGMELGVDFGMTLSCYDPDSEGRACGQCDACILRWSGFDALGLEDPAVYSQKVVVVA